MKPSVKKKTKANKSVTGFYYFLFISIVVVIPLIYLKSTTDPDIAPRLLALSIVALIFSVFVLVGGKRNRILLDFLRLALFPVFTLYLLWTILSITWAVNPSEGLFEITKTFLSLLLLLLFVTVFSRLEKAFEFLIKSILISSVIATSIGLYQYFMNVPGLSGYKQFMALYEIKGLMAHKNQYAISLFLMLPFVLSGILFLKSWWRIISGYSTLMVLVLIILIQTRSVWVALIISALAFSFLWILTNFRIKQFVKKQTLKRVVIIGGIFLVTGVVNFIFVQKSGAGDLLKSRVGSIFDSKSRNNQSRQKIWSATMKMAAEHPVKGVGAGNWKIDIIPYYTPKYGSFYKNWRRPHNDFLWVLSEKGLVGLILYLLLFFIILYYGVKVIFREKEKHQQTSIMLLTSAMIGYMIIALFTFPLERINHQIYLMMIMSVIIYYYYQPTSEKHKIKNINLTLIIGLLMLTLSVGSVYYAFMLLKSQFYIEKLYDAQSRGRTQRVVVLADKAFSPLITIDARTLPIFIYRGMANMELNKPKQAYIDFQKALKYFPGNIGVMSNLVLVSLQLNKTDEAIQYMDKSLSLFYHNDNILYNRAYVYYQRHQYKEAYLTLLGHGTANQKKDYKMLMRAIKRHIDK